MKNYNKLLIIIGLLLIISLPNVLSLPTTENATVPTGWSTGANLATIDGMKITTIVDSMKIINVTLGNGGTAPFIYVMNSSLYIICKFAPNTTVTCNLPYTGNYWVGAGNDGNTRTKVYKSANTPVVGTVMNWTSDFEQYNFTNYSIGGRANVTIYNGTTYYDEIYAITFDTTLTPPNANITFVSQTPSDITDFNLFSYQIVNVIYQYNSTKLNDTSINYSITSGVLNCTQFYNGTCLYMNGTIMTNSVSNNSINNYGIYGNKLFNVTFNFTENNIYPFNENINSTVISNGIHSDRLTGTNVYYRDNFLNLTPINNTIYEPPILSNDTVSIFYFNSSYVNGNPLTSNNVHLVCNLNATVYNHTHTVGGYSFGHQVCEFQMNTSGYVGTVFYNGGGFLIRGTTNGVDIVLTNTTVRSGVAQSGSSPLYNYGSVTGTILSHVHMFSSTEYFNYQGVGNYSGILFNSTFVSDNLGVTPFPFEPPSFMIPNGTGGTFDKFINITWEKSIPNNGYVANYTINVYNNDSSFNNTIAVVSNSTLNYLWFTYNSNLSVGINYVLGIVTATNNSVLSTSFSEPINFSSNAELNISAQFLNGTQISSFNVTTNSSTYNFYNISTTNNFNISIPIIKNAIYSIICNSSSASLSNTINLNITNISTTYLFNLLTLNTFELQFYNETTGIRISSGTIYLNLISNNNNYSNNYSTTSGSINITLLTPNSYTMTYYIDPSVPRNYYTTLLPQSYNNISLFILDSNISTIYLPIVKDQNLQPVQGAIVQLLRYYIDPITQTGTYKTVEMTQTDSNGQGVLRVVPNIISYKLLITNSNASLLTSPTKFISASNGYIISSNANSLNNIFSLQNFIFTNSYIANTQTFSYTWSDPNLLLSNTCMSVTKYDGKTQLPAQQVFYSCSGGSTISGSIIYTITDANNTRYVEQVVAFSGSTSTILDVDEANFTNVGSTSWGIIGVIITLMVLLTVGLMANETGADGMIITTILVLLTCTVITIFTGSITLTIGLAIVGAIIILLMRK